MDNKIFGQINQENADLICAKINQEADEEVKTILEKARRETEKILAQARKVAEDKRQLILKDLGIEIQKSREKILSSLNLEKKRLVLGEKDKFVQSVLAEVKKEAEGFHKDSGYPQFLEKAIIEGINVIGENNIAIYYSYLDEHLFNDFFINKIRNVCSAGMNKDCSIKLNKADFKDLGVIVNSLDGRMRYDNRFLPRLERVREEIYMELLKESF